MCGNFFTFLISCVLNVQKCGKMHIFNSPVLLFFSSATLSPFVLVAASSGDSGEILGPTGTS